MITDADMVKLVKEKPELQDLVFQRGFLITNSPTDLNNLILCSKWKKYLINSFSIWVHPNTEFYTIEVENCTYFLIGHAYNPITMVCEEIDILNEFADACTQGKNTGDEYIKSLTGVFFLGVIRENELSFQSDATAMRVAYWGIIKGKLYISSHCHLVRCIENITRDSYVDRLIEYKYYKFFGAGLPGDLSPYLELKRVQCNFEYHYKDGNMTFDRIFPKSSLGIQSYEKLIDEISSILENNLSLISQKYGNNAALSLTGGRDSTTALAGAHNQLQTLQTFSYVSYKGEQLDADAASQIASKLNIMHQTYSIQLNIDEEAVCDTFSQIIEYNMGCIGKLKEREIRKRVYFFYHPHFQVEIKSWVDEIGRARPYKRYGITRFPKKIKPRYLTTMYKVFGFNRILAHETNCRFREFLQTYYEDITFERISWVDLLYWEYSWPASEAIHLACEQMLVFDVTIPFNNRLMLEKMLAVPLEKRISDSIQIDVINKLCPQINETGILVKDFGWTKKRELVERVYWEINHRFPF